MFPQSKFCVRLKNIRINRVGRSYSVLSKIINYALGLRPESENVHILCANSLRTEKENVYSKSFGREIRNFIPF